MPEAIISAESTEAPTVRSGRFTNGKRKTFYGMVRVFQCDLMKRRKNTDLFRTPLHSADVSIRYADGKVREAIALGNATCVARLTLNDEIKLTSELMEDMCPEYAHMFHTDSGAERRFIVAGFKSPTTLRLVPSFIASEGLSKLEESGVEIPKSVRSMLVPHLFCPAINKLGHILDE